MPPKKEKTNPTPPGATLEQYYDAAFRAIGFHFKPDDLSRIIEAFEIVRHLEGETTLEDLNHLMKG